VTVEAVQGLGCYGYVAGYTGERMMRNLRRSRFGRRDRPDSAAHGDCGPHGGQNSNRGKMARNRPVRNVVITK
jgi:hypothetical protein